MNPVEHSSQPASTSIQNDQEGSLLLRALRGEAIERRPVWMMRQAGRFLPEYRAVRARTTFLDLCKTPSLAAEVTVQPVDIVGVDAAIIFSDILVIPEAMGMHLVVEEGKGGPRFPDPLRTAEGVAALERNVAGRLGYVYDAIRATKRALDGRVPVIGFAGAPLTLAAYMIEGSGSKSFDIFKQFLFAQPAAAQALLEALAEEVVEYLMGQIEAGANVLQLFDTWAGLLPEREYRRFALSAVRTIITELGRRAPQVPVIYFPRGVRGYEEFETLGARGFGIDWQTDLERADRELPAGAALQGNLDPVVLLTTPEEIERRTLEMIARVPAGRPYVVNLGHGILPHTPVEHARTFIRTAQMAPTVEATPRSTLS